MIDNKINQLNQKVSKLLKLSKIGPNALESLLEKLLDSLNVETDAAVENADRVLELAALTGLGEGLSSAATSTVEAILNIVFEQASLLMETKNFYVAFYDAKLNLVSFPFVREKGKIKEQVEDWSPRKTGRGLTEYIIRNQAPLYIPSDVDNWMLDHQDEVIRTGVHAKSWLGVPMITRDELIGVIAVQDYDKENTFDANDLNVLSTIAAQAATAIQNERLFDQTRSDLDRRDKEFKAIEKINLALTSQNQDIVLERILEAAIEIIKVPTGHILLVDDSGENLVIKAHKSPTEIKDLLKKYRIGEQGISGWVAKNKKTALIPDVDNLEPEYKKFYMVAASDTKSSLTVPLIDADNKLLGIINLESNQLDAFTNNDKALLEALSRQASIAIANRKLYEIERRTREEAEALSEISKTISSTLVLKDVLQVILDKGLGLLGDSKGSISLFDKVKNDLWLAVERGIAGEYVETRQKIGEGIIGLAAKKMQPVRVSDIEDPKWIKIYKPFIPGMRSELAVPLIQDRKLIGVFNVEHPEVGHFKLKDEQLLKKLGDHAVIAIRNAEQYEQLKALREIDQAIISASNTDQLLDLILDNALRLIGAEIGEISLVEPTTKELVLHARRRPEGVEVDETYNRLSVERGISGVSIANRASIIIPDTKKDDRYIPYFQGMRSELVVPLLAENFAWGVVSLESPHKAAFDKQDLQTLEILAGQAVIAIQRLEATKAQQLAEQRAGEAEAMGSIGQSAFELAHRLGNDLGRVKSYSNNIVDKLEELEVTSPYINEQLEIIVSDVKRVLDLSSKLKANLQLAFLSRTNEEGKVIREKNLTSVFELFETAVEVSSSILHENIEITFDIAKDVGPVHVQRDQIEDALRNLVTNAIEVMPNGGKITLRAKNVGEFVEIQVEDNGPGIEPAIQTRIFDLFFSTRQSSGFGLWSTRANVLANGGEIQVRSQLGSGTTFTLILPKPI
jgi:GAF domain-containing protein